jgi:hypothetical protein
MTDTRASGVIPEKTATRIWVTLGILNFMLLIGCVLVAAIALELGHSRYVSTDNLPGTYRGSFFGQTETVLSLRDNGNYEETYSFRDGATYHNAGQWHVEVRNFNIEVVLDNAIVHSGFEPPLKSEWRLRVRRGIRGGISLNAGDPDGVINVHKTE